MTDRIAIGLGILLVGSIVADLVMTGGNNMVFLAKQMTRLMEWIAFWR